MRQELPDPEIRIYLGPVNRQRVGCCLNDQNADLHSELSDQPCPVSQSSKRGLNDLGYRGRQRAEEWAAEAEMPVSTRADTPEQKFLLAHVRQAIETSLSQLWHKCIDRVFSRF